MNVPKAEHEILMRENLRRYRIMDAAAERSFTDIVELASFICKTPLAFLSLLACDRQWFSTAQAKAFSDIWPDDLFLAHTPTSGVLVVEDALSDGRFRDHPLVTGPPGVRFYAGVQLLSREGDPLGLLGAVDVHPHHPTPPQVDALKALSRTVVTELELRHVSRDLREAGVRIKTLHGLLPICSYCKGVRNDKGYWESVEAYVESHSHAHFTHGICPDCLAEHYPELAHRHPLPTLQT